MNDDLNLKVLKGILKIFLFFGVIFFLLFSITLQNVKIYLVNRRMEELVRQRNELEKSIYLKSLELSYLKSRERIRILAQEQFNLVPVDYRDIKLIVY